MMEYFWFALILVVNVGISWWNAYVVGKAWKDTMAFGSSFDKFLLYCGITQSTVGFSLPLLLVTAWPLAWGASLFITIDPSVMVEYYEYIFSLWWVLIIFPILGSGLVIWLHSLRVAWERRDFSSIATAGWNTYAQISNTINTFQHFGGMIGNVLDFGGKALSSTSKNKNGGAIALFIIGIMAVILALVGGFTFTMYLVKKYANATTAKIEQYAEVKFGR